MQQFKRTLLRIFMMLFLVAGVSTFMTLNADAVFADELDASEETKVEAIVDADQAAEAVETTDEVSDVEEDLTITDETADPVVVEDTQNEEVLPETEAETVTETVLPETETATVAEETALETVPAEEAAEEVTLAAKHLTVYNGVDYSLVYDYEYYSANEDVKAAFGDDETATLYNFIRWGMLSERQGIATFDEKSYRRAYVDLRQAFGNDYTKYYLHYMNYGYSEGRDQVTDVTEVQNPVTVQNGVDYSLVYDYYYFSANEDVKKAFGEDDVATLANFVRWGMEGARQGIATFDVLSYRRGYGDLRAAYGYDYPSYYRHYMNYGYGEGRTLTTGITEMMNYLTVYNGIDYKLVYDFNYFQTKYPDVKAAFGDDESATLYNFVRWGMQGERQGIATFDEVSYRRAYADLRKVYRNNYEGYYLHYIRWGHDAGLTQTTGVTELQDPITTYGNLDFASVYDYYDYTSTYQNVKDCYGEDDVAVLEHFVKKGILNDKQGKESYNQEDYTYLKNICTKFANASTTFEGLELSMVYDFYYYYEHYSDLWDVYGTNTDGYVAHFARWGMTAWRQGKSSFRSDVYEMFRQTFTNYTNGDDSDVIQDQLAQKYTSSTKYLVTISYTDHKLNVYEQVVDGVWTKIKSWTCSMGADATQTPTGVFTTSDKVYYFDSGYSRCFYATRISGSIMMHSVLYYQDSYPKSVMDGTLGANVSHGCVRLPMEGCQWTYYNIKAGTTCAIYRR